MPPKPSSSGSEQPPARPGRSASGIAALSFTVLLLALSIAVAAASGGRPEDSLAASPATGSTETPAVKLEGPTLYRIVGCLSRGPAVRGGPARREVAIGFDDGPWTDTPQFLAMLERARARATFFMIGRQISGARRALMLRALRDGDVIGDHTWSHPDLTRSGEVRSQLLRTRGAIRAQTGYTPCVFRPPYGAYNASVVHVAHSLGMATVLWNVDPTDWAQPGTAAIVQRVLAQVRPGSIIISHDGGGPRLQTLAAYPKIISALRARGYRIVTINELLGFHPIYEPCIKLCDTLGEKRSRLPPDAIIRRAP